ncbi:hypothetical protein Salat_2747200 [Sesamum alatum]|uniref:Retrotransposon gag domain-containing protein n=1 Tax=Sesamum alatum TaxID=300844 RepID=A0AAE2C8Y2_9LAMI|nr:hypothetical protein Salat_2747200 [Sesamum alatum]
MAAVMTNNSHNNNGHGHAGEVGGESQVNRGQYAGGNGYHVPTKCSQVEFLIFSEEDLRGWIYRCEQFFEVDETPFDAKVKLAAVHMEGKALQWHQVYMKSRLTREAPRWKEYKVISLARLQEQAFKLSSSSRNSSSLNNHKSFSHFSRPLAVTPPPKPPVPNPSTSYTSNRFTQIPAHRIANPNHKPILQSRRMSPQEMDEKRSKG